MSTRPHTRALVATSLIALALATPAAAQETTPQPVVTSPASGQTAPRLRGMFRFGVEAGGDKVLEFEYQDGSTPDVTAGGGVNFSLGAAYRALQTRAGGLDAQLGIGLKWQTIPEAENQDANWLRFPLEGLVLFRSTRGFGIGAGATVHFANALRASGEIVDGDVKFANTPGFIVQGEYAWRSVIFDLRYTGMQYEYADAPTAERVEASSVGLGITVLFGRKGIVK